MVSAAISAGAVDLKNRTTLDDTLDEFSCHGVGGIVGMILTAIKRPYPHPSKRYPRSPAHRADADDAGAGGATILISLRLSSFAGSG